MALMAIIILILAIALLPQAVAYAGISTGSINESHSWYNMSVMVSRQGNDSIIITNMGGPDEHLLNTQGPFIVMINGVDMTSARAVASSGHNILVNPPEGLKAEEGASVNYTGTGLSEAGKSARVVVLGVFKDGREQALYLGDV